MKKTIQTTGYASWSDPYKWMESMKGPKWKSLVNKYSKEYDAAVKKQGDLPSVLLEEIEQRQSSIPPTKLYESWYQQVGKLTFAWWDKTKEKQYCSDLDIQKDSNVWCVQDTKNGDESYSLSHYHKTQKIWSYTKSLGPYVAVLGNRVYCIESENHLWFCRLISLDAKKGTDRQVVYEEKDSQWNLTLIKGENHCLFLLGNNAGSQRLWYIGEKGTLQELPGYESYVPVGFAKGSQTPCFFGRKKGEQSYHFVGGPSLSCLRTQTPEFACLKEKIVVTRHLGIRTLWDLESGKKIDSIVGQFQPDILTPWSLHESRLSTSRPGYDMSLYEKDVDCLCSYAKSNYFLTKSEDGTSIPYVIVQSRERRPSHLIVVGYGAYGLPTHMNTDRWKPLLKRGWAVCIALIRGGGDHTDDWAEAARTISKGKSIDDFVACIRASQKTLHLSPSQTAIYGRSAGGYLVGASLSRYPSGSLFGCVYVEVPYLDVLATTSNPSLPLTQLEANEFGDPIHKPQNFRALLDLSPIDTLPLKGAPSVFVLCRTGLHDKEVFAYESFKWITRLKESQGHHGFPKLLAVKTHEGHFPSGTSASQNRANDLSLLIGWAQLRIPKLHSKKKYRSLIYKMVNTRRNRKNNASRKNRKNNATMRKNRKNNMMGGKRRRRNMTRRRR